MAMMLTMSDLQIVPAMINAPYIAARIRHTLATDKALAKTAKRTAKIA
jgi:hypothetical protein